MAARSHRATPEVESVLKELDYHAQHGLEQDKTIAGQAAALIRCLAVSARATTSGWISTKDRMPVKSATEKQHYWVISNDGYPPSMVCLARWTGACFKALEDDNRLSKVTWWRDLELPSAPTDEGAKNG